MTYSEQEVLLRIWLLEKFYRSSQKDITIDKARSMLVSVIEEHNLQVEGTSDDRLISGIVQSSDSHDKELEGCVFRWQTPLINYLVREVCSVFLKDDEIKRLLESNNFADAVLGRIRVIAGKIRAVAPQNMWTVFRKVLIDLKKKEIPEFAKWNSGMPHQISIVSNVKSLEEIFPDIVATYQNYVAQHWYKKDSLKKVIEYICEEKGIPPFKNYLEKARSFMNIIRKDQLDPSVRWINWLWKIALAPLPFEEIFTEVKSLYENGIDELSDWWELTTKMKWDVLYAATKLVFPKYQIVWKNNWCRWPLIKKIAEDLWLNWNVRSIVDTYGIDWFSGKAIVLPKKKWQGRGVVSARTAIWTLFNFQKQTPIVPDKLKDIKTSKLPDNRSLAEEIRTELKRLLAWKYKKEEISRKYIFMDLIEIFCQKYKISKLDCNNKIKEIVLEYIVPEKMLMEEISTALKEISADKLTNLAINRVMQEIFDHYAILLSWQDELKTKFFEKNPEFIID